MAVSEAVLCAERQQKASEFCSPAKPRGKACGQCEWWPQGAAGPSLQQTVRSDHILTLTLMSELSFLPQQHLPPCLSSVPWKRLLKGEVKVISRGAKRKSEGRLAARKGKIGAVVKRRKEHQRGF